MRYGRENEGRGSALGRFASLGLVATLTLATLASAPRRADAQHVGTSDSVLAKIVEASGSAPAELAAGATILDWPASPDAAFTVLREGTNGWYCLPDYSADWSYAPECFDEQWYEFAKAYVAGRPPALRGLGLSYMLDSRWEVSNTDRTATSPTRDNQWHAGGAHIMLAVPDPALLDGYPTEPTPRGGAYVMFADTPYAHLMIPIPRADRGDQAGR